MLCMVFAPDSPVTPQDIESAPKVDGFLMPERNFGCDSGLARLGNTELWHPARTEPPLDPTLSKHTGNRSVARGI
jgi:hypothetical protein